MLNALKIAKSLHKTKQTTIQLKSHLKLTLREGVFVPDETTLQFIRTAAKLINRYRSRIGTIADVGTGSGIIALSIAKRFYDKQVYAYDISTKALKLASYNASSNRISNVLFFKNRHNIWMDSSYSSKIDFVVSNPPYVGDIEYFSKTFPLEYPDSRYQPIRAIRSYDKYGIRPYLRIIESARKHEARYILFRCDAKALNMISREILSKEGIIIEKIGRGTTDGAFFFIKMPTKR